MRASDVFAGIMWAGMLLILFEAESPKNEFLILALPIVFVATTGYILTRIFGLKP